MNTVAYAKDKTGALLKFEVDNVDSYETAIHVVRQESRIKRVLCVVKPQAEPTQADSE